MGSTGELVPNYEVKALLDASKTLEPEGKLRDSVKAVWGVVKKPKKINIQFIDTPDQKIYKSGWALRIRHTEGDDEIELTYKKRYTMGDTFSALNTAEGSIGSASESAKADGFDSSSGFEAQVEVGQKGQTLSMSAGVELKDDQLHGLPGLAKSQELLEANAPPLFKAWLESVDSKLLRKTIIFGPVHAKKYKGTWEGKETAIEVWPIRKAKDDPSLENIVEASFKTDETRDAVEGRAELAAFATEQGFFLPQDSLKTKLIMERYGQVDSSK